MKQKECKDKCSRYFHRAIKYELTKNLITAFL